MHGLGPTFEMHWISALRLYNIVSLVEPWRIDSTSLKNRSMDAAIESGLV